MDSLVLIRAGILLPHALLNRRSVFLSHCWELLCHLPFQASPGKAEKIPTYEPSEILACSEQGVSPFHPWPELEKTPLQPWDELKIGALSLGCTMEKETYTVTWGGSISFSYFLQPA